MAENKKSFILYTDLIHVIEELTEEEAGRLFKHILRYVNDQNPETPDRITALTFKPIMLQLKRDLKDWELEKLQRSDAGHKGGLKSAEIRREKAISKQNEANSSTASKNEANQAVTVTVTDTVNVNVNVTEDEKKEGAFLSPSAWKNINQLSKEFFADKERLNIALKTLSTTEAKITELMINFLQHLQVTKDVAKSEKDFASHFINYSRIKLNPKSNGNSKKYVGSSANIEQATDASQFLIKRSAGTQPTGTG